MQILFSLKLPARLENLQRFLKPVSECAKTEGFNHTRIQEVELALEEALVNIFKYAYPEAPEDVEVGCGVENDHFIIEIIDAGVPFDLTSLTDPDLTADVEERKIGGLGIFLVKKMVDEVRYRREKDRNILTLAVKKEKG
jgi:serine/threonine-protein kinase RsbW